MCWQECSICIANENFIFFHWAVEYSSINSMDTFNLKHLLSYPVQQSFSAGRPPWPIHCVPWRSIPMSYASVLPHAVLWAYLLARGNNWRRNILQRWSNHTIRKKKDLVYGKWKVIQEMKIKIKQTEKVMWYISIDTFNTYLHDKENPIELTDQLV